MQRKEFGPLYLSRSLSEDLSPISSPRELSSEELNSPRNQITDKSSKRRKFDNTFCKLLKVSDHKELQIFLNSFDEEEKLQFLNSNLEGKINTPLTMAISEGNLQVVICLINNGADVDFQRQNYDTPLTLVAKKGNLAIAKILLNVGANIGKIGANINKLGPNNNSPLYYAALCNHPEMVDLFLERGADTSIENTLGYTPLAISIKKGYVGIAKAIIKFSKEDINKLANFGETPLINSIRYDREDLFIDFLNHENVDLDCPDIHGFTPITWAISKGNSELVDMLIFCGANPGHMDKNGNTPLIYASKFHNLKIVQILCTQDIDINHKNNFSQSALSIAKKSKDEELVRVLSQAQKRLWTKESTSWQVLEVVSDPPSLPQKKLQSESQDSVIDTDFDQFFTPRSFNIRECNLRLMLAILSDRPKFIIQLLDNGAQINHINEYDQSPACLAAEFGRIAILEILVERYPESVNQRDGLGNTPLILAAMYNKTATVNFLIKKGADPFQKNNAEQDAFDVAMVKGHGDVVKELMIPKTTLIPSFIQSIANRIFSCSGH